MHGILDYGNCWLFILWEFSTTFVVEFFFNLSFGGVGFIDISSSNVVFKFFQKNKDKKYEILAVLL